MHACYPLFKEGASFAPSMEHRPEISVVNLKISPYIFLSHYFTCGHPNLFTTCSTFVHMSPLEKQSSSILPAIF